ncbi:Ribonucleases P MRP protein subunit POP1 containing protein [Musa troglodytarum]|uniref:Ribonucleases P MRP protein subunit POP1 containing protein n=1 Tax=Musa troglodytarum TaxID=320322 RepID=A0A9E7F6M1_9LILI|nr:Ribonucleases P MRP protein subunit POP1 containing protein [Musa troglodytarum]URD90882.1 Ribonucleases P MRP protein subunit POP1 containing protein [Musa troglodytarum]
METLQATEPMSGKSPTQPQSSGFPPPPPAPSERRLSESRYVADATADGASVAANLAPVTLSGTETPAARDRKDARDPTPPPARAPSRQALRPPPRPPAPGRRLSLRAGASPSNQSEEVPSTISAVAPPPRTLNVQKFAESRAAELDSLHSIISTRLNHDFRIRRDKRRRTTGHRASTKNHGRPKRRKLGVEDGILPENEEVQTTKKVSRRTRRRMEFRSNPSSGFCTAGDGTKRLRTHLWHAKRFTMVKRWGFYLPLGLHGRENHTKDSILAVLRMVLFPSPYVPSTAPEKLSNQVAHGVCYGKAMLYHIEAPVSNLISPVIYMWQPFLRDSDHVNAEKDGVSNSSGSTHKDECSSPIKKLWIWIHAAAFNEGFGVIDNACQKQMHECGVYVRCFTLEGQIARLEVMGSKAIKMIKKILHPVSQSCSSADNSLLNQSSLTPCSNSQVQKSILLCHAEKLPSHAILPLTVHDPRDLPSSRTEVTDNELSTILEGFLQGEDSLWSRPETNGIFLSDSISLWDCSNNLNPPVPESIICKEKHDRRLKDFYLEPSSHACAATESGLPSFPFDFPDCKAYTSFMADEAAAFDTASELCPLAVRPSRVPKPSPWNSIVSTVIKGPNILRGFMTMDAQTSSGIIPENSILDVDSKDKASSPERQAAVVFPANLYLLLWTQCRNWKSDASHPNISEGDRDLEELQVPQSFVRSCFTEQNSGKWELQDCEDSLALQTFRWPIGFVTTGFVRGSSKPVAEAFCEARLLAMLRGQQSCDTQTAEAEIFVFVRNMRSTAYRPWPPVADAARKNLTRLFFVLPPLADCPSLALNSLNTFDSAHFSPSASFPGMETLEATEPMSGESPTQLQSSGSPQPPTAPSERRPPESRYLPDASGDGASVAANSAPVTPSGTEAKADVDVHFGNGGMGLGSLTGGSPEGIPFAVGDLVWGKTKNHPWWPALVSDPFSAPIDAKKAHLSDVSLLLVYCFGSGAYAWCEPAQLKPFVEDFHRMTRQSSSKSFVAAVEGALDEIRRRLQLELTCGCVPPEAGGKTAECPGGRLPVSNFRPLEFLEHLQDVACDVTMADVLKVAALRSWVIAFGKGWTAGLPGYHPRREIMELVDKIDLDVPPGDLGDGNEEGDGECSITGSRVRKGLKTSEDNLHKRQKKRSMAALIAGRELDTVELSEGDEFTVEEKVKGVKNQMIKKEKDMDADGCGVEAQEDTGSGRRERKKSKYLSPPYTCLGAYTNTLDSPRSGEVKSPRKAAEASRALNSDISSLLRCDSEAVEKEEDTSNPGFGIESTSVNDILLELLCTARNPLHLKWNQSAKMIKSFFNKYRSSMYSSGSDFLTYQKLHNECCLVSIESPNKLIVNNISVLGKSEGGWKDKKDSADLQVETGLTPDSRSCSEQGKAGRKRKMRKNEDNNVTPADLEPRIINIPVKRKT